MNHRTVRLRRIFWAIVIVSIVFFVGRILIGIDDWNRDWTTNRAEISPVVLEQTPDDLTDRICAWVGEQSRWKLESADRGSVAEHNLQLTRKTLIMNFKDDVSVNISADGKGGSVLKASSQSRVGKGDLGQNPRNLKELLSAIE